MGFFIRYVRHSRVFFLPVQTSFLGEEGRVYRALTPPTEKNQKKCGAPLSCSTRVYIRAPQLHASTSGVIDKLYARRRVAHGEIALGTRRGTIRRRRR